MPEYELKPCPFCGGNNVRIGKTAHWVAKKYQNNIRVVGCADCGVLGGVFNTLSLTEEEAVKRAAESWNRRAECYTMSCYDCIHCDRCSNFESGFSAHCADVSKCKHFRNKADFVEVVRCKDCRKYSGKYCLLTDDTEDRREPDDFCSCGERKEE